MVTIWHHGKITEYLYLPKNLFSFIYFIEAIGKEFDSNFFTRANVDSFYYLTITTSSKNRDDIEIVRDLLPPRVKDTAWALLEPLAIEVGCV